MAVNLENMPEITASQGKAVFRREQGPASTSPKGVNGRHFIF